MKASLTYPFLAVTLLGLATACSREAPDNLPPAPITDTSPYSEDQSIRPGSRAHFIAEAGSDTVYFVTDSHDLDPEARSVLDAQARWLIANPAVRVTVEGHCDERGTREYNLALGERRANAAKNYLAAMGVSPERMSTISYGKEQPVALASDPASWARNRRSVTVVPM